MLRKIQEIDHGFHGWARIRKEGMLPPPIYSRLIYGRSYTTDLLTHADGNPNLNAMEDTLFTKIIAKKIPAKIAFEDSRYIAIHDISPQAPVHLLVITKKVIPTLNDLKSEDAELVGGMFLLAAQLMKQMGHTDYRTVFNCGPGANQTVFHIHLHVLAGRKFDWPPG